MKLAIDFSRLVQKSLAVWVLTVVPESLSKESSDPLSEESDDESWLKEVPTQTRILFRLRGVIFLLALPVIYCLPFIALGDHLSFSLNDLMESVKNASRDVNDFSMLNKAMIAFAYIIGGAAVLSYCNTELAALAGIICTADLIFIIHGSINFMFFLTRSPDATPASGAIILLVLFVLGTLLNALEIIIKIKKIFKKQQ